MRKNAKLYRNALRGLVAALALGGLQVAHAGYAQLAAPAGYASTAAGHTYAAAANDKVYGKVVHQAGALTANVGGQAVKMPAAYRLAANAPRIAAAAIYLHPGIRTAVGVASWLMAAALVWDAANKRWVSQDPEQAQLSDGFEYKISFAGYTWRSDPITACKDMAIFYSGPNGYNMPMQFSRYIPAGLACELKFPNGGLTHVGPLQKRGSACPAGWYVTPAGCAQTPPNKVLTEPDFVEKLAPIPMPETVPQELPYPTPLPVEQPFINPAPGENPSNRPQRVPTGQPIPIPNTDPQQWRQPYVDIVPAPTPESPWRVDVKPGEVTSTDPNPVQNPKPDAQEKPTEEQDKSLCEKHPDILACQKPELDTPDGEIPRETKTVTYAEEGGFGGGSCPGNIYSNVGGKSIMVYNWSETCGVVSTYLRPIILLLGAMGALFILIPGRDS